MATMHKPKIDKNDKGDSNGGYASISDVETLLKHQDVALDPFPQNP